MKRATKVVEWKGCKATKEDYKEINVGKNEDSEKGGLHLAPTSAKLDHKLHLSGLLFYAVAIKTDTFETSVHTYMMLH
jgi:hypothetical protein